MFTKEKNSQRLTKITNRLTNFGIITGILSLALLVYIFTDDRSTEFVHKKWNAVLLEMNNWKSIILK